MLFRLDYDLPIYRDPSLSSIYRSLSPLVVQITPTVLRQAIQAVWKRVPQDVLRKMLESMLTLIEAVFRANSNSIGYQLIYYFESYSQILSKMHLFFEVPQCSPFRLDPEPLLISSGNDHSGVL